VVIFPRSRAMRITYRAAAPGARQVENAEVIDAAGQICSPGLVNAAHAAQGNLWSRARRRRWTLEMLLIHNSSWINDGRTCSIPLILRRSWSRRAPIELAARVNREWTPCAQLACRSFPT